jgi:hypothetical protein
MANIGHERITKITAAQIRGGFEAEIAGRTIFLLVNDGLHSNLVDPCILENSGIRNGGKTVCPGFYGSR